MSAALKKDKPTFTVETVEDIAPVATPPAQPEPAVAPTPEVVTTPAPEAPMEPVTPTESFDTSNQVEPEETPKSFNKGSIFLFIGGFLLGGAIVGGIFWYRNGVEEPVAVVAPTPTPTIAATATPTPTVVEIDYSKLSVNILNGSGTPGEAGAVQALLETAEFSDFTTGNASAYDYKTTEIAMKESVDASVYDTIKKALSKYEVKKAKDLPSTSDYDIVITVGSTKTKS